MISVYIFDLVFDTDMNNMYQVLHQTVYIMALVFNSLLHVPNVSSINSHVLSVSLKTFHSQLSLFGNFRMISGKSWAKNIVKQF